MKKIWLCFQNIRNYLTKSMSNSIANSQKRCYSTLTCNFHLFSSSAILVLLLIFNCHQHYTMRIFTSFVFGLIFVQSAFIYAQNPTKTGGGPEIIFDHTLHNFGKVSESIKFASHRYPFTNTGNQILFIQQVHTSCGCTTPDWTRDSIPQAARVTSKHDTKPPTELANLKIHFRLLQRRQCAFGALRHRRRGFEGRDRPQCRSHP